MIARIFLAAVVLAVIMPGKLFSQTVQNTDTAKVKQKDLIDIFSKYIHFHKKKLEKERKVYFSVLPLSGATNNGNRFLVTSFNATFRLGAVNTTDLSSVYFIPYTNLSTRFGFIIKPNIWLSNNLWNMNGDLRIIHNDVQTYGLGGNSSVSNENTISNDQVRIYLNANRQVKDNFYVGMGYNLDYFYRISQSWSQPDSSSFQKYGYGTGPKSTTSGFGPNFLFDSRTNSNNPINGFYSSLSFRVNPNFLGSTYNWWSVYFDNRKYISLNDHWHSILAFWGVYWGTYGNVPYLDLPTTSGDVSEKIGRGYSRWRYRGKQMLYSEAEYRFDLSANGFWGAVIFANAQSFTQPETNRFSYVLPAAGVGLRIKFNKKSNVNVAFDFAVGKNSFNWYLTLGEFF
jgi:outer membrane protein assembly factor BamA